MSTVFKENSEPKLPLPDSPYWRKKKSPDGPRVIFLKVITAPSGVEQVMITSFIPGSTVSKGEMGAFRSTESVVPSTTMESCMSLPLGAFMSTFAQ